MKGAKCPEGASHEAEKRREQREAPVYRLKQIVEK